MNYKGAPNFVAYSAGSHPSGTVRPEALRQLEKAHLPTQGFRSKSWDEFAVSGAPQMRVVITVCDSAAAETCPYWPGSPVTVHWSYADPSKTPESERPTAFELTRQAIAYRMLQLVDLPFGSMSDAQLQAALNEISHS